MPTMPTTVPISASDIPEGDGKYEKYRKKKKRKVEKRMKRKKRKKSEILIRRFRHSQANDLGNPAYIGERQSILLAICHLEFYPAPSWCWGRRKIHLYLLLSTFFILHFPIYSFTHQPINPLSYQPFFYYILSS